nr:T9SS type A sorting domain-containing protein [Marinoscillum sp. MHG1-6]
MATVDLSDEENTGTIQFGDVAVSSDLAKLLYISNGGSDAMSVTEITAPAGFTLDKTSATVSGPGLAIVTVTFAPTEEVTYSGYIVVKADAGTDSIAVNGKGVTAALGSEAANLGLKIGPNPIQDEFMVDWSLSEFNNPSIRVMNIDGKVIWEQTSLSGQYVNIDLSGTSSGMFFLEIKSEENTHLFKLIKE